MRTLYAALALAVTAAASPAAAQFTAAVVPPKPAPRVDTVAVRDSMARNRAAVAAQLADMKVWVDSAAAALARAPASPEESAAVAAERSERHRAGEAVRGETVHGAEQGAADTVFRDGGRAPATATPLPLLVVVGAGALLTGVALLRR